MTPIVRVGDWSIRHPWRAIAGWLGFVLVAVVGLLATGSKDLQSGTVGESARGYAMLASSRTRPAQFDYGYLHSGSLQVGDPSFRSAIHDVRKRMHAVLHTRITVRTSPDGHAALLTGAATREFAGPLETSLHVAAANHPAIAIGGDGPGDTADSSNADLHRAELLAVPVTLLVLLFAFGSIVAAAVPVLLALTAVIAAFGLLGPLSQLAPLDSSVKTVVLLIGMAVGVDYALFYVIRSRQERAHGLDTKAALERTVRTSGHTVIVAGATVAVAMAGQYVIGDAIFTGLATGTIAVVGCAVAGSVTVLPGLLALLGGGIDRGRIPHLPHLRSDTGSARFWPAVVDGVLRRPRISLIAATGVLVTLAVPAFGMHIAEPPSADLQPRQGSDLAARMHADFPGTSEPAIVVISAPRGKRPVAKCALERLETRASARGIAHPPFALSANASKTGFALDLPLTGTGENRASRSAVAVLRTDLIPKTLGRVGGVRTAVTGTTAEDVDFTGKIKHGIPYVMAFVLGLAFVILLFAFRSIVVPVKAIVLNLLSVAASYGVIVLVFQHHWAEGLLGFTSDGAIISWLPLFLFVVLFGLSMDYHVLILSRIREAVDAGMTPDDAVRDGVTHTAGVVTSAALVMVGVFAIFGTLNQLDVKQAGVGLAAAILIDATIVRAVLLPASMKLLGEWNWYLPGRRTQPANDPSPQWTTANPQSETSA